MGLCSLFRICDPDRGTPYLENEPNAIKRTQQSPHKSASTARVSVPSTYKEDLSSKGSWTDSERSSPALSNTSPPSVQRQWQHQHQQIQQPYHTRSRSSVDRTDARSNAGFYPLQTTTTTSSQRTGMLPANHPARVSMESTHATSMHPNYPSATYPSYSLQSQRSNPAISKWQTPRSTTTGGAQMMPLAQIQRSMSPLSAISTDKHESYAPSIRSMGSRDTLNSSPPLGYGGGARHAPYGLSPVNELPGSIPSRFSSARTDIPLSELPGDVPLCVAEMAPVELADTDMGIGRARV